MIAWCRYGVLALTLAAAPSEGRAQTLLTQDEALQLAFPEATDFDRRTSFLTEAEAARVEELTGAEPDRLVVPYYVAKDGAHAVGVGYFDVHRVRTVNEALLIAIDKDARVMRVEVVAFAEPREYRAPARWLELFHGKSWEDDLGMKGDVPNLTGATLTTRSVKGAVARILTLHDIIDPLGGSSR